MSGVRYCVVSRMVDGEARVFGTYTSKPRADAFAERVNAAIEKAEDEQFAEWNARTERDPDDMMPQGYGRVVVLVVNRPDEVRAREFALGDFEA